MKRHSITSTPAAARRKPATCRAPTSPAAVSSTTGAKGAITELFDNPTGDGTAPLPHVIQCESYAAYPAWALDKPHITLMGFYAHVRRKYFEGKEQEPRLVAWILRQIGHLYRIESGLCGHARIPKPHDPPAPR